MRWFEVLSAALFTLDTTGSGLAVAVVSAARTLPMLLLGAFAGVMPEAVDRKRVLLIGQLVSAVGVRHGRRARRVRCRRSHGTSVSPHSSPAPSGPPRCPRAGAWSASACRRAGPRALALDTMTNSITRLIGPIAPAPRTRLPGLPVPTLSRTACI